MRLSESDRGVSAIIGALFAFVIILSLAVFNQVTVVPNENEQVEFNHYEETQNSLQELRNAQLNAGASGETRSASVRLGTTYPSRSIAMNAPPASGRLETTTVGEGEFKSPNINFKNVCGTEREDAITTNHIKYQPAYNYFQEESPQRIENTVYYQQQSESSGSVLNRTNQIFIQPDGDGGGTVALYPLTASFSRNGAGSETIEFVGGETGSVDPGSEFTITAPTSLSVEQWRSLTGNSVTVDNNPTKGMVDFIFPSAWTVQCSPVDVGSAPEQGPVSSIDDGGGGGGSSGSDSTSVGTGSISNYDENSPSETFSLPNGRWRGITCTDQLVLSDGQPASKPNGNNLQGDVIRFTGRLNDSTGENYTIDVKLARGTDGTFNKKVVKINDGNGDTKSDSLTAAAAKRIYESDETDMLELSNYNGPGTGSDSFSGFVNRTQALEDDAPVVWQTSRMTGRATVALECDPPPAPPASGAAAIDGTTPSSGSSALQFDIQVASGTNKTITDIKITNQNSNVKSSWQLKRPQNKEARLTVSNTNGVNQSGGLKQNIKLDGTKYELDTDAVFSDGAVLDVDMGEIQNGNVKLKYDLVDSESKADVTVTFYFEDDTSFQAYLRVTSVNS